MFAGDFIVLRESVDTDFEREAIVKSVQPQTLSEEPAYRGSVLCILCALWKQYLKVSSATEHLTLDVLLCLSEPLFPWLQSKDVNRAYVIA